MENIAVHMRITGLQVSNEDVDARKATVADLVARWSKTKDVTAILAKASEIAQALGAEGTPPEKLGAEVEGFAQQHASAFLSVDRPLEVGICAGVALIDMMALGHNAEGWAIVDVFASAAWSALSFQPPLEDVKREALRMAVLKAVQLRSVKAAEMGRQRSIVSDFGDFTIVENDDVKTLASFKKATGNTIAALRRNAALDREEIDFLWWTQVNRSKLLDRAFAKIDEPVRLVASAIEAAGLLRRLPCDVHRDIVLRTLDANPQLDLGELIAVMGDDRAVLGGEYSDGVVVDVPLAFPLLHALATGTADVTGAQIKRPSAEWGARALLEAGLAQISTKGLGSL